MPRNQDLSKRFKQRIRDKHEALKAARHKKHGTPLYTDATIWAMLSDEFLLTPRRLQDIVYMRDEKRPNTAPDLFNQV